MPFSLFDARTQSLLYETFDEAWLTLGHGTGWTSKREAETMDQLTPQRTQECVIATGSC
jgi:hypothetical protein